MIHDLREYRFAGEHSWTSPNGFRLESMIFVPGQFQLMTRRKDAFPVQLCIETGFFVSLTGQSCNNGAIIPFRSGILDFGILSCSSVAKLCKGGCTKGVSTAEELVERQLAGGERGATRQDLTGKGHALFPETRGPATKNRSKGGKNAQNFYGGYNCSDIHIGRFNGERTGQSDLERGRGRHSWRSVRDITG